MSKRYDHLLRLLLVGDTGVGKTCIICQYTKHEYCNTHISTIGVDFKVKTIEVNGQMVKMQIWDTAGQERFEAITKQFYRRAQGVMVVYDICSQSSFESLPKWISYVRQFAKEDTVIMVMGNKKDEDHSRKVDSEEAERFAEDNDCQFFEVSAKQRENLEVPFYDMCRQILNTQDQKNSSYSLSENDNSAIVIDKSMTGRNNSDTSQLITSEEDDDEDEDKGVRPVYSKWACCSIL
ncbi:ras-related protein Rab-13-like [Haliotis cracherodii]|uniref:ras-related protein Rab-13-like n=1 Tax=Haliotis cracherodii TaxID=6455 RepID=UPI0039EC3531